MVNCNTPKNQRILDIFKFFCQIIDILGTFDPNLKNNSVMFDFTDYAP